jgi:hypothetical protein
MCLSFTFKQLFQHSESSWTLVLKRVFLCTGLKKTLSWSLFPLYGIWGSHSGQDANTGLLSSNTNVDLYADTNILKKHTVSIFSAISIGLNRVLLPHFWPWTAISLAWFLNLSYNTIDIPALLIPTLTTEATGTSEMLVTTYKITQHHNP